MTTYYWHRYNSVISYYSEVNNDNGINYNGDTSISDYAVNPGFDSSTGQYTISSGFSSSGANLLSLVEAYGVIYPNLSPYPQSSLTYYGSGYSTSTGRVQSGTMTSAPVYAQGSADEGYVFSTTSSTYSNGRNSDGYWYVYQGIAAPSAPTWATQPASNASISMGTPTTISWNPSSVISGSGLSISNYTLQYSTNGGSTWTTIVTTASASYTWTPSSSSMSSVILRVIANQSDGTTTAGPNSNTFTVVNAPPNAPTFSHITSGGSTVNSDPKLFFNVSDPTSGNSITNMEVQVSTDSTFSTVNLDGQYGSDSGYGYIYPNGPSTSGFTGLPTTTNTSSQITWIIPGVTMSPNTYHLRARCKNNNGLWSAWSATQQYTVAAVPWNDVPSGYGMKAQWMNDIRDVTNNTLSFRGYLQYPMFNLDTTWDIQSWQISIRRKLIDAIAYLINESTPSYTNNVLNNLMTDDQATGGWHTGGTSQVNFYVSAGTLTAGLSTSQHLTGGYSYYTTLSISSGTAYMTVYTTGTPTAVTTGQLYSAEVWFMAPSGRKCRLVGYYQDSTKTRLTSTRPATEVIATGSWQRIAQTFIPPSGAAYAETEMAVENAQNGDTLYVQMMAIYKGNVWDQDRSSQDVIDLRNALTTI